MSTPLTTTEAASHGTSHTEASFFRVVEPLPPLSSEVLARIGPFAISNTTTTVVFIALLCTLVAFYLRKATLIPKRIQSYCEFFYEKATGLVAQIVGDEKRAKVIAPYIASLMLYIIIANLLPMIPPVSAFYTTVTGGHTMLFRGTTTDFNTTFALALAIVVMMQIVGMKFQGVFGYLSHFIQIKQVYKGFRRSFGQGMMAVIGFFVGLIEIISEVAKVLSLSLRLFGNMFAHEVLTIILLGAFAFALPVVWMGMGVLVGVVQSLVFVALTTVYFSLVAKKAH